VGGVGRSERAALVFGAMLVALLAEALDAYHRRWR
jgi:hypothetical protein